MNKNFLEHYMKTKPETTEQKYLFLVDNQDIAYALIYAGYPVIFLFFAHQPNPRGAQTCDSTTIQAW